MVELQQSWSRILLSHGEQPGAGHDARARTSAFLEMLGRKVALTRYGKLWGKILVFTFVFNYSGSGE